MDPGELTLFASDWPDHAAGGRKGSRRVVGPARTNRRATPSRGRRPRPVLRWPPQTRSPISIHPHADTRRRCNNARSHGGGAGALGGRLGYPPAAAPDPHSLSLVWRTASARVSVSPPPAARESSMRESSRIVSLCNANLAVVFLI